MPFVIIAIVVVIAIIIIRMVRIVPQAEAFVIERLGAYKETWGTGLHLLIPFLDRISNKVTKKEIV